MGRWNLTSAYGPHREWLLQRAYDGAVMEPDAPLLPPQPMSRPPCARVTSRNLLVASLFAHEVDTLEILLEQHKGYADVMLAESTQAHSILHPETKPLLWGALKKTPRFESYNVTHVVCPPVEVSWLTRLATTWDHQQLFAIENAQNDCLSNAVTAAVTARTPLYHVVIVGSVDEMLSEENLYMLKHCELPMILPTSSAVGMPFGLLNRSYRTDWHYPNMPNSFSLPTVYPAEVARPWKFTRSFEPIGDQPTVGGIHLSNYCGLANTILKANTATEAGNGDPMATMKGICSKTLDQHMSDCVSLKRFPEGTGARLSPGFGPEYVLPRALASSPERFPSWLGKVDPRDKALHEKLCDDHNFWTMSGSPMIESDPPWLLLLSAPFLVAILWTSWCRHTRKSRRVATVKKVSAQEQEHAQMRLEEGEEEEEEGEGGEGGEGGEVGKGGE